MVRSVAARSDGTLTESIDIKISDWLTIENVTVRRTRYAAGNKNTF